MSSSLQVGLRSACQCALRGLLLRWGFAPLAARHAGEESRRQHNHQHNHQHIGGFCRRRVDGFQPLPPIGDSRKKISCWNLLLLLLSPAAVGASLRSPLAIRGRRAATSTTTITTTSTSVDFAVVGWMASSRCRR